MTDENWGAGDPSKWNDWGLVNIGNKHYQRLIWGEHKHSYSDNKMYVVPPEPGAEPIPFDGHRILIDVQLTSKNYLKESELSGDEIRKGGTGQIIADEEVVYEFFFRDIQNALLKAYHLIGQLSDHSSFWLQKKERVKLVGREVYYERTPARITRLITDQGCIILEPDGVPEFPNPIYNPEDDEYRESIKTEVLDPKIWWYRE